MRGSKAKRSRAKNRQNGKIMKMKIILKRLH